MRVFLDTNVVIDFYAKRGDFFRPAAVLVDLALHGRISLYVSSLSFVNAYYVLSKTYKTDGVREKLSQFAALCQITPIDESIIRASLTNPGSDFEDKVQFASAQTASPDIIITRNTKHFEGLSIPVKEPSDFLDDFLR